MKYVLACMMVACLSAPAYAQSAEAEIESVTGREWSGAAPFTVYTANGDSAIAIGDSLWTATDGDVIYGVAGDDHEQDGYEAGDHLTVITQGPVVANVATGVGSTVELGSSTTAGELAAGSSVKGLMTKFSEGEGPEEIPSGAAHVDV